MSYPAIIERAAQITAQRLEAVKAMHAKAAVDARRPEQRELRAAFEQWKLHPDPEVAEQMFDQAFGDGAWMRQVELAVRRQRKARA